MDFSESAKKECAKKLVQNQNNQSKQSGVFGNAQRSAVINAMTAAANG